MQITCPCLTCFSRLALETRIGRLHSTKSQKPLQKLRVLTEKEYCRDYFINWRHRKDHEKITMLNSAGLLYKHEPGRVQDLIQQNLKKRLQKLRVLTEKQYCPDYFINWRHRKDHEQITYPCLTCFSRFALETQTGKGARLHSTKSPHTKTSEVAGFDRERILSNAGK